MDNVHERNLKQWFLALPHNRIIWELFKTIETPGPGLEVQFNRTGQNGFCFVVFFLTKVVFGTISR